VSAREELAEQFDLAAGSLYPAHETMFANEALDAALIGTPHTFYYEQIVAALEHDLHVLCDKVQPLGDPLLVVLTERAERSDRTVMVGYQRHLYPAFVAGHERWREHEPDFLTAEITQGWIAGTQGTWRLDPTLSGGSFLYDTGSHLLDVVLWMTDLEPASIAADMAFYDDEERIDERARLSLDFANGATAAISIHGDARSHQMHTHVWDDAGTAYFESHQWGTPAVTRIDESGETTHPSFESEER
jgi:predicted dehydrogenase